LAWRVEELRTVSQIRFHARQAAVALLKMAKATSDADLAANAVRIAADIKDRAGDLAPDSSLRPPDVESSEWN
jgi:hypothetical protein